MTHYTVLVALPDGKTLDEILLPFHEYESTGIRKYLKFAKVSEEELVKGFEAHQPNDEYNYIDADQFAKEHLGLKYNKKAKSWGFWTNPNAKWDWYVVGGRWHNYYGVDFGFAHEFKFKEINEKSALEAVEIREKFLENLSSVNVTDEDISKASKKYENSDWIKSFWNSPEQLARESKAYDLAVGDERFWWDYNKVLDMRLSKKELYNKEAYAGATHAFIDEKGKWHERGQMGWFASCAYENESSYDGENGEFWTFINNVPRGTVLLLVDCHI